MSLQMKCFAFLMLSFSSNSLAQDRYASGMLEDVLTETQSLQAEVEQYTLNRQSGEVQSATGTLKLRRPGQLNWQSAETGATSLICNGNTLWVLENNQVNSRDMGNHYLQYPILLLSIEPGVVSEHFEVTMETIDDEIRRFTLTPKQPGAAFETISLTFVGSGLKEVLVKEDEDILSGLYFTSVIRNITLAEENFEISGTEG